LLASPDIGVTQIAHRLGVSPATLYHEATRRAGRAYRQALTRTRHGDDRFGGPGRDAPKPD
jgi:transposase-like protein